MTRAAQTKARLCHIENEAGDWSVGARIELTIHPESVSRFSGQELEAGAVWSGSKGGEMWGGRERCLMLLCVHQNEPHFALTWVTSIRECSAIFCLGTHCAKRPS